MTTNIDRAREQITVSGMKNESPSERLRSELGLQSLTGQLGLLAMGASGEPCAAVQQKALPLLEEMQREYVGYFEEKARVAKTPRQRQRVKSTVEACLRELDTKASEHFGLTLPLVVLNMPQAADVASSEKTRTMRADTRKETALVLRRPHAFVPARSGSARPQQNRVTAHTPYQAQEYFVAGRGLDAELLLSDDATLRALRMTLMQCGEDAWQQ
jgi:hypothetical protein